MTPYQESEALAFEWFTDPKARRQVAEILNRFHLDETAIEAEAIRSVAADLELLDRMLMSLEVRRNVRTRPAPQGVAIDRRSTRSTAADDQVSKWFHLCEAAFLQAGYPGDAYSIRMQVWWRL